jgi:hypothetical protein
MQLKADELSQNNYRHEIHDTVTKTVYRYRNAYNKRKRNRDKNMASPSHTSRELAAVVYLCR